MAFAEALQNGGVALGDLAAGQVRDAIAGTALRSGAAIAVCQAPVRWHLVNAPPERTPLDFATGLLLADADGWTATGKPGRVLPDGTLLVTRRKAALIDNGGTKRTPSILRGCARLAGVAASAEVLPGGLDHIDLALVAGAGFDPTGLAIF